MLTDEQLQQIRERVSTAVYRKQVHEQRADGSVSEMYTVVYVAQAAHDMMRLLNEVERLQGRVHALKGENTNLSDLNDAQLFAAAETAKHLRAENAAMREIVQEVAAMPTDGIDPTAPYHVTVTKARAILSRQPE